MKDKIYKLKNINIVIDIHENIFCVFAKQKTEDNSYLIGYNLKEIINGLANIYRIEENKYIPFNNYEKQDNFKNILENHSNNFDNNNIHVTIYNKNEWQNIKKFENNKNGIELSENYYLEKIKNEFGYGKIDNYSKIEFLNNQMFEECDDGVFIMYPPKK